MAQWFLVEQEVFAESGGWREQKNKSGMISGGYGKYLEK